MPMGATAASRLGPSRVVVQIRARPGGVQQYIKERKTLPALHPPPRPMLEGDAMLEELVKAVAVPPKRERPDHDWIRGGTWKLVDQRLALRKEGRLSQAEGRRLIRRIHKAFNEDRKERALQAGHSIMASLKDGDWRAGYGTLRAWTK